MLKHCVEIMFGNKGEGCCRHVFLVNIIITAATNIKGVPKKSTLRRTCVVIPLRIYLCEIVLLYFRRVMLFGRSGSYNYSAIHVQVNSIPKTKGLISIEGTFLGDTLYKLGVSIASC